MLYTRKGDDGTSGLWGTRGRFPKDGPVYEALGDVDELNSLLGVCRAKARGEPHNGFNIEAAVLTLQEHLFVLQAELAGAPREVTEAHVSILESAMDRLETFTVYPHHFVISGETELSGLFDYARAVARRAERSLIAAKAERMLSVAAYAYMNRLSSFLYALARHTAAGVDAAERAPSYGASAQKKEGSR